MLEAVEGCTDFIENVPVARGELIAEDVEERKIDRVGPVRIRRMNRGLDIGRIVEQEVKHIVTLMLVCPNDFRVDRDVVRHQGVGDDPFFQPKVFGRIAGVYRGELGLELCPSLLEWSAPPRSYCRKMANSAIALLTRSLASRKVSRRMKLSEVAASV